MDKPPLNPVPEALTAETAFVVHLGSNGAGASTMLHGRVEHVRSGQSRRFASAEELVAFMRQTLANHSSCAGADNRFASNFRQGGQR